MAENRFPTQKEVLARARELYDGQQQRQQQPVQIPFDPVNWLDCVFTSIEGNEILRTTANARAFGDKNNV